MTRRTFHPTPGDPLSDISKGYAQDRPHDIALRYGEVEYTWKDLHVDSNLLAHSFSARGVTPGSIVSLLMRNGIDMLSAALACYKVGAIPQPLSPKLASDELHAILELGSPSAVIAQSKSVANTVTGHPTSVIRNLRDTSPSSSDLPSAVGPSWKAPVSGGSTGRPKIIVSGRPAEYSTFDAQGWDIQGEDCFLMTAPLHHNAPFATAMTALLEGAEVTVMERFEPEAVLRLIQQHSASWIYLVPTMMRRISALRKETRDAYDLSSLREVWHCAEPCPPWLKEEWIEWLGPERIWELYAGTEAHAGTTISGSEWLEHPGSVGRVKFGEMKVVDDNGDRIDSSGVPGEIYMRVSSEAPPSFQYIGAELEELEDGWSTLGDIGSFDDDGYLYILDRRSDVITVGGVNVYPAEIEGALVQHPKVLSAAVIGLPDDDTGNRVHSIIETAKDTELDDKAVLSFLSARISAHKLPQTIDTVHESLRDDSGKVRRSSLRTDRL